MQIGGGTGWNIEKMAEFVDVPNFFHAVYLVDLSTSLCEVARKRFAALGWKNVKVICQDARLFDLSKHETTDAVLADADDEQDGADLVTMSYALSMIPDYYSVIDSMTRLLGPDGIIGVVDFYVQNQADLQSRNYIGGLMNRHCTWISRTFWRTWFELDRVNLEAARRVSPFQTDMHYRLTGTGLPRVSLRHRPQRQPAQQLHGRSHPVLHLARLLERPRLEREASGGD